MKALLYWLTSFLPCKIIDHKGAPYLERYYLFTVLGVRFYLHRFVDSDPGRGLHDHPWPWAASVVLSGWYYEERRGFEKTPGLRALAALMGTEGLVRRKVRWFNWLRGDTFHRVVLPKLDQPVFNIEGVMLRYKSEPQPCWSLFFHRAAFVKPWGFLRPMAGQTSLTWVPHNSPGTGGSSQQPWWLTAARGKDEPRRLA